MFWVLSHFQAVLLLLILCVFFGFRKSFIAKRALKASLLIAFSLLSFDAHALLIYLEAPEFVAGSDIIVVATVDSVEAKQAFSRGIYTEVAVTVTEVLKGKVNVDAPLVFTVSGGRMGGLIQFVSDSPSFSEGEEVVLNLKITADGDYVVFGGVMGKATISTNPTTGAKTVQGTYTKAYHEDAKAKGAESDTEITDADTAPLEGYVAFLKGIVRDQKKAPLKSATAPS